MIITWYGQSCFELKGDKSIVVTDPYTNEIGLRLPRLTADIVTISHDHFDHNNPDGVKGTEQGKDPFVIQDPGEYELKETLVYGIPSFHDSEGGKERGSNIIYRIEIDGISVAHLGDLGHELTETQLEKLEGVDILLVPVGGVYTLDGKGAASVINQLEPRVVIPMHYRIPGLKTPKPLEDLDRFCKEIALCPKDTIPKYKIVKKDLPQDQMQVVVLSA